MKHLANILLSICIIWCLIILEIIFFTNEDIFHLIITNWSGYSLTTLCGSIWLWHPWLYNYNIGR